MTQRLQPPYDPSMIGMQVKIVSPFSLYYLESGTIITAVDNIPEVVLVRLKDGRRTIEYIDALLSLILTPQEADQQQREQYAEKYL